MASLLLRGFALGLAIAATPGPIFFLCLRRSLLRGWQAGLASGLGVATADAAYAAVAVFGIAAVTDVLAGLTRWLELGGGLALVVVGVRALVATPATREAEPVSTRAGLARAYGSTLGLTITNPATIISFAALAAALSPTDIRATGVNWAHGVARVFSTVGPFLGGYLLDNNWSLQYIFFIFAIPLLLASGCVVILGAVLRLKPPAAADLAVKESAPA